MDASVAIYHKPISKLPCSESLVDSQLRAFQEENSVLQPQSDFKPAHSTISTASAVANDIVNWRDKKQHCPALFVDLAKDFDIFDHNILLNLH